ncbi:MAG: AAA family ATPase, partial [Bdellovibrionia bacterium]
TLTHAMASRCSALGMRVLMIDGDQQANLSKSFGVYSRPRVDVTLFEVYNGRINDRKVTIKDAVVPLTDFLHIIPANLGLANLDLSIIQGTENIGSFFAEMLAPIRDNYDLIFFDCPPSISRITSAACCFADKVILPINADAYSIEGLHLSTEHLLSIHSKFNTTAELQIVMNKFDARAKLAFSLLNQLMQSDFKECLCDTYVSTSKEFDNSIADGKCLWNAKSGKNPALEDIHSLIVEIFDLKQWLWKEKPEPIVIPEMPQLILNQSGPQQST